MSWSLYIVRAVDGSLYAGIATDVERRYREHVAQGPRAAKYLLAHKPAALVFTLHVGTRSLALKVEHHFKRLAKRHKEAIVRAGVLRFDPDTGCCSPP